MIRDGAATV